METLDLAVPLVRRFDGKLLRWMARLDPRSKLLEFLIADRIESESFRETVTREVAWELGLDRSRDFLVSNMAQMNLQHSGELPGYDEPVQAKVAFYNVEIYRSAVGQQLESDPQNYWVKSDEIWEGKTKDGLEFDPLLLFLIRKSSVIQAWESTAGY